ncbi:Solute carrier family 13 member 3-like [Homarus americanus]|uniref:Solute carrier family 13 member 3-like n=1 Tax=Homarus americanus TaxID=6706 RepID=A0A8J5MKR9_HOMAM|nr:Solute carrier family 13 member 3-like [Homarus americanus]
MMKGQCSPCTLPKGWWQPVIVILTPLILSLLPFLYPSTESRCAYVIIVMAVYWITEALPLAVTALVPIFAFPLLGVLSTAAVCQVYLKDTNFMFMGGLIMAVAVEHCNLHKRIALFVILHVGQSPRLLMAGFMITTIFLSMWISNTAAAAMLVPIVDAVVLELCKTRKIEVRLEQERAVPTLQEVTVSLPRQSRLKLCDSDATFSDIIIKDEDGTPQLERKEKQAKELPENEDTDEESKAVRKMFFLGVAFAANIGGTGSPLGCGPNLVVMGILQNTFEEPTGLNFATWMMFNVPGMIICGVLGWCWLQILFMFCGKVRVQKSSPLRERAMKMFLRDHYDGLGRITQHELVVLTSFTLLVFLIIRDATPVMLMVCLLFTIPAKSQCCSDVDSDDRKPKRMEMCLTWEVVHEKLPWGIILLLGGGLAMAEAAKSSGLSVFLGQQLQHFDVMPKELIVFVVCLMTAMLTEVASNTATASVLLPVIKDLALGINVNPLYLMLPATVCCAYAFMLPVATPGNAIILTAARMSTHEMMRAGAVMNVLCVLVITLMINTLGVAIFDLHNIPSWVNSTTTSVH